MLDTYQSNLDVALSSAKESLDSALEVRAAELAGLIDGYWRIIAPSYEAQFGAEQRELIDASVDGVAGDLRSLDTAGLEGALPSLTE